MAKDKGTPAVQAPVKYVTVARRAETEFEEKRSIFICNVAPVKTEEEAMEFIKSIKKKYPDATHNVWAYLLCGEIVARYSDDGEPQGTAGVPALEAIRKSGVTDVAVVITRYFGGIMLGAGGLVRAYSHGASLAVEAGEIIVYEEYTEFRVKLSYSDYQKFSAETKKLELIVDGTDFSDFVFVSAAVKSTLFDGVLDKVNEMFAGRVLLEEKGKRFDFR